MTCQQELRAQGKPYPRTCEECGLGPCKYHQTFKHASATHEIPDDVVERALYTFGIIYEDATDEDKEAMRAVGRVFVEWERERIERILTKELCGAFEGIRDDLIAAIRARSREA